MARRTKAEILQDLDEALAIKTKAQDEDHVRLIEAGTRMDACLRRNCLPGSAYDDQAGTSRQRMQNAGWEHDGIAGYRGILTALRRDIDTDRLESIYGQVSAEIAGDLLDQADELLRGGFLLAAGVLAGAALEERIRGLCTKMGIQLQDAKGPRKATNLNDDLKVKSVYDTTTWKQVTAWQGIRNDAAHNKPEFKNQTAPTLTAMLTGIREFVRLHPV